MSSKKVIIIDSSGLKELICPLRYYRTVIQGYKPKQLNISLAFGLAFHEFRKVFRSGGDNAFGRAVASANKLFKSFDIAPSGTKGYLDTIYLTNACFLYAETYAKDTVKPIDKMLEIQFPFPYRITDTYEVIIIGTIDEISKIDNGIYCIVDCKTAAKNDSQIESYLESYSISRQLMMYIWLVKQFHKLKSGTVFDEIAQAQVGAQIDGVFTQGKDNVTLRRSRVFLYKEPLWSEFLRLLDSAVDKAVAISMATTRPDKEGIITDACSLYGGCPYFTTCCIPEDEIMDLILNRTFKVKPYDPLHHND